MKKLGLLLTLVLALTMKSHQVFAQSVTIPLMPGWNWISVPLMDTLDFQTAMGSVTPVDGDIIKSHWGFAAYSNGQWRGTISQFYPGYGYHYKSNRAMPVMLTFNAQQPTPQVIVTTSNPTDITANSATCGGNVASSEGNYVFVISKGICWSTNPNPTFNDNYVEVGNGIGSFTASMTGLTTDTTYYVRAFAVTENGTFFGNEISFTTPPEGVINSLFSINANGDQVYFSQGNLQYQASTNTWRFAENQWDYVGDGNANVSSTYNGWIDLFNWGTSGYNHGANCYQPWSTSVNSSDYYAYGISTCSLNDSTGMADWGYNAISNGGNQENQWYVLSYDEWNYVLFERETSSGIRFARAKVNGFNGIIILSDNWDASNYSLNNTNVGSASYSQNSITSEDWINYFQETAVFLPCAGNRSGTYTYNNGNGDYWSSTRKMDNDFAYDISIQNGYLGHSDNNGIFAQSVRLVRPSQLNTSYIIEATPNPTEMGSVMGFGEYLYGAVCTLTATANEGYTFTNWTENGEVVSTNTIYSFRVTGNRNLVANFILQGNTPTGAINGLFSVGENQQVYFSQGNLQYQASTNTWRFAENQWDFVGDGNTNISSTYDGWIDLFGWGTSGYDHGANCYQPWSTSTSNSDYYAYGNYQYNLNDQTGKADWGYNPISNGSNAENSVWRTMTKPEWDYVFNGRNTASGIRYVKAKVNNVNGVILLPDDWTSSYYTLNEINTGSANYDSNTITIEQWNILEQHNAVFLPAAGDRNGTSVIGAGSYGVYWSATHVNYVFSSAVYFYDSHLSTNLDNHLRYVARSIRLVRPSQVNTSYSIEATPNPTEGGSVMGFGEYLYGSVCTLTATANDGYTFTNWTENDEIVSTNATYSFRVTGNRTLVANFIEELPFIPTEGLVAYYPFDGNTNDYSGNGNHGTIIGNVVSAPDRHGNPNGAYRFPGISFNYISVPDADILHLNTFTLSAWVYTDADDYCLGTPAVRPIINKGRDVLSGSYRLSVTHVRAMNQEAGVEYIPEVGQWHLITGTVEGNQARFYIDGVLQTEATFSPPFSYNNSDPLAIGMHYYSGVPSSWAYPFLGVIDEVRIYNRALTPQEVSSLYGSNGGCLSGVFSVSANSQVNFSQGNLQYQASTNTWRFAEHQWDCVGEGNANISSTYDGWIDLFGWGTSGYNHGAVCYQPWSTSGNHTDYYAYGQWNYNLYDQTGQADWGNNAIVNGGNQEGLWRTLNPDEWYYVFKLRSTASGIRYAYANVNGINGVILLPDDWNSSYYSLNNTNVSGASYNSNTITETQWNVLEQHGAVFFPAAGFRIEVTLHDEDSLGLYWSSSYYNGSNAHTLNFSSGGLYTQDWCSRIYGASVRLVRNVE